MNELELENHLRSIAQELKRLYAESPDMLGSDFARDHGWISQAEHKADENRASAIYDLQETQLQKIVALRQSHPDVFQSYMQNLLSSLQERMQDLKQAFPQESKTSSESSHARDARFIQKLIPSVIECLESWQAGQQTKHWPAWAWRIVFSTRDQIQKLLKAVP